MPGKVVAQPAHFVSPIGGWNALNAIAAMPPTDAVRLDNFFPETSDCRLRNGSMIWYDLAPGAPPGSSPPIRSLMTYSAAGAASQRLLAAASGTIFDVTNQTNAQVGGGFTSDLWQYVNFATPGGQFWVGVNGADQNQWIWAGNPLTPAFAGQNTTDASVPSGGPPRWSTICSYQSRLFFCSDVDMYLYYLPVNVYQGEVHAINLGSYFTRGGNIAFIGNWTRDDSTLGMNELLVIGTTLGEIIVFRGVDPDDPSNWFLAGLFEMGFPVAGHRQLCSLGPDMMLINQDGFQSMSNYIAMGQSKALTTAISQKIGNAVTQAVVAAGSAVGWEACLYPKRNALLVNVPQAGGGFQQYVVNTMTGSWCRFLGLNAWTWTIWNGNLMFGSDDAKVWQADIGGNDNGTPISFDVITAFQVFGNIMQQKRATMVRPFVIASGRWYPVMDVNTDYSISAVTSPVEVATDQTNWDQFNWDEANWADNGSPQHDWYSVQGIGTAFALRMSGTANGATVQLMAFDIVFEPAAGFV